MRLFLFCAFVFQQTFGTNLRGPSPTIGHPSRGLISARDHYQRRQVAGGRELGKFDWDLGPVDGYPQLGDFENGPHSILFLYNFTGDIEEPERELVVKLFQDDCLTPAPDGTRRPLTWNETLFTQELQVDVDVQVDSIADSVFYTNIEGGQKALISFCLRVVSSRWYSFWACLAIFSLVPFAMLIELQL